MFSLKINSFRKYILFFFTILSLFLTFQMFILTPLESFFFQILNILLLFFFFYIILDLFKDYNFKKIHFIYFFLLSIITPLTSAFVAFKNFGQPIFYGIATERGWLLIGGCFLLYDLLRRKANYINILKKSFLLLSFLSLLIYSYIIFFIDLSQYADLEIVRVTEDRGIRLKANPFFITFGIFFFITKFLRNSSFYSLVAFLLFFSYIIFIVQGRSYSVAIILSILFLVYNYYKSKGISFKSRFIYSLIVFISMIFFMFLNPNYFNLFTELIYTISGEIPDDMSLSARVYQGVIASDFLAQSTENLFFGAGKISHQWNGGYEKLYGYFHPGDLGLFGGLYLYGLLGIIFIWLIPFNLGVKLLRKVDYSSDDPFTVSLALLLFLSIITSINAGTFFFLKQDFFLAYFTLRAIKT